MSWRALRRFEPSYTDPGHEIVRTTARIAEEVLGQAPAVNMCIGSRGGPDSVRQQSGLMRRFNPTHADFDPVARAVGKKHGQRVHPVHPCRGRRVGGPGIVVTPGHPQHDLRARGGAARHRPLHAVLGWSVGPPQDVNAMTAHLCAHVVYEALVLLCRQRGPGEPRP